jgi:CelD/BcsL family acetyltransferase involved in cellulose biosynthesis
MRINARALAIAAANSENRDMNFHTRAPNAGTADAAATVVAREPAFDFSGPDYRALHANSDATVFQSPAWLDALHREVAPAFGATQATVTVRDQGGRLMMVLPLVRRRQHGVTVVEFADFGLCDYNAAICDLDETSLLDSDALLPRRLAAAMPRHDLMTLTKMTREDPLLQRLFPNASRTQMRFSAYPTRLGTDWKTWHEATLAQGFRRDLGVKRRRLERLGAVQFVRLSDTEQIARALEALRQLRSARLKSLGAHDVMADDTIFAFYRRMAIEGAQKGFARTECLSVSGEVVAVQFGLTQRGTYLMLMLGADIERFGRTSPGILTLDASLRAAIDDGEQIYDFTIGDHPYKQQFGAQAIPLYEWHRGQTLYGRAAVPAITLVREAKRVLKPWLKPVTGRRITAAAPDSTRDPR